MDTNTPDKLNRIVEGTTITGDVVSDSNIRVDGKLKGTIATKGRLVIGKNGIIEGEVVCNDAEIEGQLKGTIKVNGLLSLKATSKLEGDILTSKLSIEPGAAFSGSCSMGAVVKDINAKPEEEKAKEANEKTA